MKVKKIITQGTVKPQAPDVVRPKRKTPVYTAIRQATNAIYRLRDCNASKRQIRDATDALFTIIARARSVVRRTAGMSGVITQAELHEFLDGKFIKRFESGCPVEPGRLYVAKDSDGILRICDHGANWSPSVSQTLQGDTRPPRESKIKTPTPAQLQAWFNLPSEPPAAADSPAGN